MRLADRNGLRVTPIPAAARGMLQSPSIVGLVPAGAGFYSVQVASKEMFGAIVGR